MLRGDFRKHELLQVVALGKTKVGGELFLSYGEKFKH